VAAVPVLPGGVLAVRLAAVAPVAPAPRLAPREGRRAPGQSLMPAVTANLVPFPPACPVHGQMRWEWDQAAPCPFRRQPGCYWWACHGFDGEGCPWRVTAAVFLARPSTWQPVWDPGLVGMRSADSHEPPAPGPCGIASCGEQIRTGFGARVAAA